ncbi:MAG: type II toxin-antitoxin system Phd/YefM family antitoxin [Spirochaetota bacterium]
METISVSQLKAHLSEELRKVEAGASVLVLDHKREVAMLVPIKAKEKDFWLPRAIKPFVFIEHELFSTIDPMMYLAEEREDR